MKNLLKLFIACTMFFAFTLAFDDAVEVQKLVASDRAGNDQYGKEVDIDGDYAVVGAYYHDGAKGAVYVYKWDGSDWNQQAKLQSSDINDNDCFGRSVAIDGEYLIVGAHGQVLDENGLDTLSSAGAAYIFKRSGSSWTQQQKLAAFDRNKTTIYGAGVDIDGDYAVVGSYYNHLDESGSDSLFRAGAAYVYKRDGSTWSLEQKLVASDREEDDRFGVDVAICGEYIIAGANREDDGEDGDEELSSSGSAYIFKRDGSTWSEEAKISGSSRSTGRSFGMTVGISGERAIVGAMWDALDENGENSLQSSGSAYIFKRSGTTWSEEVKLLASDRKSYDNFGVGVSISGDTAVVTGYRQDYDYNDDNYMSEAGAAYLFEYSGSTWEEQVKFLASDRDTTARFGNHCAVKGDWIIVSSYQNDFDVDGNNELTDAGAVYIYDIMAAEAICATDSITDTTRTSAIAHGDIDYLGSTDPTQHGVCYSTSSGPTIENSVTTEGATSSTGAFTTTMTGLASNTTYYARIYVTNDRATSYGDEVSFTTLGPVYVDFTDGNTFTYDPTAGQNDWLGRFSLESDGNGDTLTNVTLRLDGLRSGFSNFSLWVCSTNMPNQDPVTQYGSTVAVDPGEGQTISFSDELNLPAADDQYFYLKADLAGDATGRVHPTIVDNGALTISNATINGTLDNEVMRQSPSIDFTDGSTFAYVPTPGENDYLGRFTLESDDAGVRLDSVSIRLDGVRTGLSNISLWASPDNSPQSPPIYQYGSTVAVDPGEGAIISFVEAFELPENNDYNFYLKADIASNATGGVQGVLIDNSSLTLNVGSLNATLNNEVMSGSDTPLPVELTGFDAKLDKGNVCINWETASETENAYFIIYRNDEELVRVEGAGTSSEPHVYSYIDKTVIPGRTYEYVLADVTFDNSLTRHEALAVELTIGENLLDGEFHLGDAYPNPFNPLAVIPLQLTVTSDVRVSIYDLHGRLAVESTSYKLSPGFHDLRVNGSSLSTGTYIVRVDVNDEVTIRKVILLK